MYKQMFLVRRFRLSNVDRKFQVVHLLALMHFSIIMDIVQRYLVSNNFYCLRMPYPYCCCNIDRLGDAVLAGNHDSMYWCKNKKVNFVNSRFRFYYIKVCGVYLGVWVFTSIKFNRFCFSKFQQFPWGSVTNEH